MRWIITSWVNRCVEVALDTPAGSGDARQGAGDCINESEIGQHKSCRTDTSRDCSLSSVTSPNLAGGPGDCLRGTPRACCVPYSCDPEVFNAHAQVLPELPCCIRERSISVPGVAVQRPTGIWGCGLCTRTTVPAACNTSHLYQQQARTFGGQGFLELIAHCLQPDTEGPAP